MRELADIGEDSLEPEDYYFNALSDLQSRIKAVESPKPEMIDIIDYNRYKRKELSSFQ